MPLGIGALVVELAKFCLPGFSPNLFKAQWIGWEILRGSLFVDRQSLSFHGLNFADTWSHAHYTLYNRADFVGLIFAVSRLFPKNAKFGPLENSPLDGIS
jgi:hypothetical protein